MYEINIILYLWISLITDSIKLKLPYKQKSFTKSRIKLCFKTHQTIWFISKYCFPEIWLKLYFILWLLTVGFWWNYSYLFIFISMNPKKQKLHNNPKLNIPVKLFPKYLIKSHYFYGPSILLIIFYLVKKNVKLAFFKINVAGRDRIHNNFWKNKNIHLYSEVQRPVLLVLFSLCYTSCHFQG